MFEKLVEYVQEKPKAVLEVLKMIVEKGNFESWDMYIWKKHLLRIFENIRNAEDKKLISNAMELMDTLRNMGYGDDFRDMWERASNISMQKNDRN